VHLFNRGDVVHAWYYWRLADGTTDGGYRPVVIKELVKPNRYVVMKITRTPGADLFRIRSRSKEWNVMGLYDDSKDSYVDKNALLEIGEHEINDKLGTCPPDVFAHLC
jgi:hypothetical protein